jgi:hypothetical protein
MRPTSLRYRKICLENVNYYCNLSIFLVIFPAIYKKDFDRKHNFRDFSKSTLGIPTQQRHRFPANGSDRHGIVARQANVPLPSVMPRR